MKLFDNVSHVHRFDYSNDVTWINDFIENRIGPSTIRVCYLC